MAASGSDSGYVSHSSPSKSDDRVDLSELTPGGRQKYYRQYFSKHVEPLVHITRPGECSDYPKLQVEITEAYLRYTNFSVQVWTNYDAAARKFYFDARTKDCGQPIIKPSEAQYLDEMNPDGVVEIHRVLLEIGTPFTTLANVLILAKTSNDDGITDLTAKFMSAKRDHKHLTDFIRNQCNEFNESGVELGEGQQGLIIADINDIAKRFCRYPSETEMSHRSWGRTSAWMDFHDENEENDAWVDMRELNKGCNITCDACNPRKFSGSSWYFGNRY